MKRFAHFLKFLLPGFIVLVVLFFLLHARYSKTAVFPWEEMPEDVSVRIVRFVPDNDDIVHQILLVDTEEGIGPKICAKEIWRRIHAAPRFLDSRIKGRSIDGLYEVTITDKKSSRLYRVYNEYSIYCDEERLTRYTDVIYELEHVYNEFMRRYSTVNAVYYTLNRWWRTEDSVILRVDAHNFTSRELHVYWSDEFPVEVSNGTVRIGIPSSSSKDDIVIPLGTSTFDLHFTVDPEIELSYADIVFLLFPYEVSRLPDDADAEYFINHGGILTSSFLYLNPRWCWEVEQWKDTPW